MVKIATQWYNPNRQGTWTQSSNLNLITNSGSFLTTNSGVYIVTSIGQPVATPTSSWTKADKSAFEWIPYLTLGNVYTLTDQSGNSVVDQSGNNIVSGLNTITNEPTTKWTNS